MPLDLALDLAHALDPVGFVQDRPNYAFGSLEVEEQRRLKDKAAVG